MRRLTRVLGPGLLFAAAAVGVSHLVQSTRAGAGWGLAMFAFIIFANIMKYPAFRFGPHYAAATNRSLLQGYREQGKWALVAYLLLTLGTMFTVQAAVTMVTAGLLKAWLGLQMSPFTLSIGLLVVCAAVLYVGRYHWLDRITKVLVVVFTIATVIATVAAIPRIHWGTESWFLLPSQLDKPTLLFLAALIGWMPSAIDASVWNSLWTLAKNKDDGGTMTLDDSMLDFHVGYIGIIVLAICFLLLGTGIMHGSGEAFEPAAGKFAAQVLALYVSTLGEWSRPVIGVSAFAVMFSTTLAVMDGFPRALAVLMTSFVRDETEDDHDLDSTLARRSYFGWMAVLMVGAIVIILALRDSLPGLVDVATTLSFLTAPMLATLNHRAIMSESVPQAARPSEGLRIWSLVGIALMTLFAVAYLVLRAS